jgi:hypothetical protein
MTSRSLSCAAALCALAACSDPDFPVYNELDGFRVLALRTSPPDLVPGSATQLDALVYDAGDEVTWRWSLCPWPSDPNQGYACVVNQALWDAVWQDAGLSDAPPLALGDAANPSVALPNDRSRLRAVCNALLVRLASAKTLPPDCEGTWRWSVQLAASAAGTTIEAVKSLPVLLGEASERNANPVIERFSITRDGAAHALQDVPLEPDHDYALHVEIANDQAQEYTPPPVPGQAPSEPGPRREALIFTWFVEGGETDRVRSIYREGVESLSRAARNRWHTPATSGPARLFVVVRDNRGGVDFARGSAVFPD